MPDSFLFHGRARWLGLATIAAPLLIVAAVWWARQPARQPPPPAPQQASMTEDCTPQTVIKNRAVAELENEHEAVAAPLFEKLRIERPDDPLPLRNLAVCQLVALQNAHEDLPARLEASRQVEVALEREQSQSAAAQWLAGLIGLARHEKLAETATEARAAALEQARAQLTRAASLEPDNPAIWFSIHRALSIAPAIPDRAAAALAEAFRLAPKNVFILLERMLRDAEQQNVTLRETLQQARHLLRSYAPGIQRRTRVNIDDLLTKAESAIDDGRWPQVLSNVRVIANVVRPENVTQSDRTLATPHPLTFVLHDFDPPCPARINRSLRVVHDVRFEAAAGDFPWRSLTDVLDLALADCDLDGRPDLWILRPERLLVFSQPAAEAAWSVCLQVDLPAGFEHILLADLDRDVFQPQTRHEPPDQPVAPVPPSLPEGPRDLPLGPQVCFDADCDAVLWGSAGCLVLRQDLRGDGTRTLTPVAQPEVPDPGPVRAAALADLDQDGDLDLALASVTAGLRLWSNRGNLTFEDVSQFSTLPDPAVEIQQFTAVDWDRDIDLDLLIFGPEPAAQGYLENMHHGEFRWVPWPAALAPHAGATGMCLLEADGNASWDTAWCGPAGVEVVLTRMLAPGDLAPLRRQPGQGPVSRQLLAWDFDNDGYRDLLGWSEAGLQAARGQGDGTFEQLLALPLEGRPRACVVGDFDLDGDEDCLAATERGVTWIMNGSHSGHHWINVRARGDDDAKSGRVNQYGMGSLMEVRTGSLYQAQVIAGQVTHFGLGDNARADALRIVWNNGIPQAVISPASDQVLCERQTPKGSCPYAYTWNGKRFEFFTDLLWNAPLGLQLADGVIAPSRGWEYLKLPGAQLQPRQGQYVLQITEELWEAAYFDQVELLAVDHPADVEVYSNEKVGPAELAELRVHTVRTPRPLRAAQDGLGRDCLRALQRADGDFAQPFARPLRMGLTDEWSLELDFGLSRRPARMTLFLTGWVRPGDTSLRVANSHNPDLPPGRPPSLAVPQADGTWREVLPFMGFPGGKTKTIAVDLSNAFLSNDCRLRISSSLELYWDQAFCTVNEEPAEVRLQTLPLASADLHYRGCSPFLPCPDRHPFTPDYGHLDLSVTWPPIRGFWTRYGDVRPLLTRVDDLLVVLGAGDEMTLSFALPAEPPPAGWTRDFLLHSVGWDKDADLHTVHGSSVEPLPHQALKGSGEFGPGTPPDSAEYAKYLRKYQTRTQRPQKFWRARLRDATGGQ